MATTGIIILKQVLRRSRRAESASRSGCFGWNRVCSSYFCFCHFEKISSALDHSSEIMRWQNIPNKHTQPQFPLVLQLFVVVLLVAKLLQTKKQRIAAKVANQSERIHISCSPWGKSRVWWRYCWDWASSLFRMILQWIDSVIGCFQMLNSSEKHQWSSSDHQEFDDGRIPELRKLQGE